MKFTKNFLLILCIFIHFDTNASLNRIHPSPIQSMLNFNADPSMINSVDFHPKKNLFCVTFTHNHMVVLYQVDAEDRVSIFQTLQNPAAELSCPQHALFSKDGQNLLVANWCNQTFTIYHADSNGFFQQTPIAVVPFSNLENYRPHGIAFSPDGNYLGVAFGASRQYPRGVALYQVRKLGTAQTNFKLLSLFQGKEVLKGIPKGIAFSPDGSCLILTFSESNSAAIYTIDWRNGNIDPTPRQILKGKSTKISRPEDIKFTVDGNYCAISNSDEDTVTFYKFDKKNNFFFKNSPAHSIQNPEAQFCFPHGLAFSSDGKYLSVTQFGPIDMDDNGNLSWHEERKDSVAIFKLK